MPRIRSAASIGSWSQPLKRVFGIDVFVCPRCKGFDAHRAWVVD
jgi:hypothetical protein